MVCRQLRLWKSAFTAMANRAALLEQVLPNAGKTLLCGRAIPCVCIHRVIIGSGQIGSFVQEIRILQSALGQIKPLGRNAAHPRQMYGSIPQDLRASCTRLDVQLVPLTRSPSCRRVSCRATTTPPYTSSGQAFVCIEWTARGLSNCPILVSRG